MTICKIALPTGLVYYNSKTGSPLQLTVILKLIWNQKKINNFVHVTKRCKIKQLNRNQLVYLAFSSEVTPKSSYHQPLSKKHGVQLTQKPALCNDHELISLILKKNNC